MKGRKAKKLFSPYTLEKAVAIWSICVSQNINGKTWLVESLILEIYDSGQFGFPQ